MHLRQWMMDDRHSEIDDELISHLKSLSKEQVQQAIKESKRPKPKRMIRGTHGNQLSLPVTILLRLQQTYYGLSHPHALYASFPIPRRSLSHGLVDLMHVLL